jgi:hypothetical protein
MESTDNCGQQGDLMLASLTPGVPSLQRQKSCPVVATPKGHCHDTDHTAWHSHCHVWMHGTYINFIPGTCKCNNQQCSKVETEGTCTFSCIIMRK